MKKALVVAFVLVLGLGVLASAAPFSGSWDTSVTFGTFVKGSAITLAWFDSELNLQYTVGGWTFASTSVFWETGFHNQFFTATGTLGAFGFGSYLDFDPATPVFVQWLTGSQVSIAGVTFYGFFDLEDAGSGWLLGGSGSAGDLTITVEAGFNLNTLISYGYDYDSVVGGFADFAYAYDPVHGCSNEITVADDAFDLQTDSYCFCWSNLDIELTFPFACIDEVILAANFNATDGFGYFKISLNDIMLGVPWLTIDDFDLTYTVDAKIVSLDVDVNIDSTCLTPYFELIKGTESFQIQGLNLYALGLSQAVGNVTFSSITVFDVCNYGLTWGGSVLPLGYSAYYCMNDFDELFEIEYTSDACCGGAFSIDIKNWFDMYECVEVEDACCTDEDPAVMTDTIVKTTGDLFGWGMTEVNFSIGMGSNFTLSSAVGIYADGLDYWQFGFGVTF